MTLADRARAYYASGLAYQYEYERNLRFFHMQKKNNMLISLYQCVTLDCTQCTF